MKTIPVILPRYCAAIRQFAGRAVHPHWLPVIAIAALLYIPFLLKHGWEYRGIGNTDLPSFWAASVQVFRHQESPYNREALQQLMTQDVYVYPYLYPPPSLLFFYPLSLIDYAAARHIVLLGNHLIIFLLLFAIPLLFLRPASKTSSTLSYLLTCVCLLAFKPIIATLNHGQINILLLALLLGFWILAKARYPLSASLFLALAIFLKTYPIIILPILLVIGRKRECVYTSGVLGLGMLISFLVIPSAGWLDWMRDVLPTGGYQMAPAGLFSPAAIPNQSLNGFFGRAFTESPWSTPVLLDVGLARMLTYVAAGAVVAVSLVAIIRASVLYPTSTSIDRAMMVALPAMYLIAPFSWEHHLVYLLPSILLLLTARSMFPFVATVLFNSATVGATVLIALDGALQYKFYGVLVLWILCIFTACSRTIQLSNNGMQADAHASPR